MLPIFRSNFDFEICEYASNVKRDLSMEGFYFDDSGTICDQDFGATGIAVFDV